jgi:hypothetical protein
MRRALRYELLVPGVWERIDLVRESVARALRAAYGDPDLEDALAMVCAELLENAMKYGRAGATVQLCLADDDDGALTVTVENAIDADSHHTRALHERVEWLRGYADPAEAYTAALTQVYAAPNIDDSGLGLVRIAYEGGCRIDCDLSNPAHVVVRARREPAR